MDETSVLSPLLPSCKDYISPGLLGYATYHIRRNGIEEEEEEDVLACTLFVAISFTSTKPLSQI